MKSFLAFALAVALAFTSPVLAKDKNIGEPKGFDNKVFHASFALYATSEEAGVDKPKFLCTVTSYKKINDGYLLIGAGHCTSANPSLPSDLKFFVSEDLNTPAMSVQLVKSELSETVDFSIFYLHSEKKYPVISFGDEKELSVGDKTVDVHFSLGAAKITSPGLVSSLDGSPRLPPGTFLVQQFDSHGASGSAVVSERTHKIVGIVKGGWDGATMPTIVESISHIEEALAKLNVVYDGKNVFVSSQEPVKIDVR
jgi:hypothetical protein